MKESAGLIGLIGLIGLEALTDGLCAGHPSSSLCGVWGLSIGGIVGALLGSLGVVYPCDLLRSRRLCTFAPAKRQRGLCSSLHNGPIAQLV